VKKPTFEILPITVQIADCLSPTEICKLLAGDPNNRLQKKIKNKIKTLKKVLTN
jgi:hypothetical protein